MKRGAVNLVTGASGFIGGRLVRALERDRCPCRASTLTRSMAGGVAADLLDRPALATLCVGVSTVFHCAGYAHAFASSSADEDTKHWRINFEGTRNLAEAAGQAGVRHFVFLSSVKAMADPGAICADEDFPGQPETAYGRAKRAAEDAVLEAGGRYGMQVVNLRLAMVYGRGGRGNLERMAHLVRRGIFPSLPDTGNRRSMVHVDDVVSAMRKVAGDEKADGKTYIVAGREAPSGRELYDALRVALGLPPCNWSTPAWVLRSGAAVGDLARLLTGRRWPLDSEVLKRLLESACYSADRINRELDWRASVSLADGLVEMVRA